MRTYRVLAEDQAQLLCEATKKMTWSEGRARTKELTGTIKRNSEILQHSSLTLLGKKITGHPEVQLDTIPLKTTSPKYSKYEEGQRYQLHTDAPWMGQTRTDLACTLWLNGDYQGGQLVVDGLEFKGKPGEALIYECGAPHEVLPVTSGERICVITWIQSRIRCPHKRKLISSFRRFLAKFEDDQEKFVEGSRVYSALLRMWIE